MFVFCFTSSPISIIHRTHLSFPFLCFPFSLLADQPSVEPQLPINKLESDPESRGSKTKEPTLHVIPGAIHRKRERDLPPLDRGQVK